MAEVLSSQAQVLTWRQAIDLLGVGRVRGLIRSRRWRRYGRGVLVAHNGPMSREQQEWAAVLETGDGALLAGLTAAALCGLRGYDQPVIHILAPANRRPAPRRAPENGPPVRVYRTTVLAPQDALSRGRPPQTTAARSLVDAAQWATTDRAARAIIAAGVQQRLSIGDELREVLTRMPRARRRSVIADAIADAAGGAHSLPERELRRLCRPHRRRLALPTRWILERKCQDRALILQDRRNSARQRRAREWRALERRGAGVAGVR